MAFCSSSSPPNWVYDVFPSFSGEEVRVTFLSHFLKELDRKLIIAFKDNEIERSQSLDPELKLAIRTSKIAVVVFSEKYASSSWCLNELLEIVKCKKEFGQLVIPVFYRLDPSHVRKQTGKFGEAFLKTCQNKTEDETKLWKQMLTDVANLLGYHSQNWDNEAKMIEVITNNVLKKLLLTASTDSKDYVGIENHIVQMSALLQLESEEVRMVGIWGCSGIGKTTIARALYSQLSRQFQGSVYIDKAFVSKSIEIYKNANPDDYNMKLHLLRTFLSEILDKKDIRINHLGAMEERLKHQKVLIFIDDLDDQMVLDTLAGEIHWFGRGSRIIVITKDKHFLRAHGIDHIYEVSLPSEEIAFKMFCRAAFKRNSPPHSLMEIASEIALRAGNLPLGLKVLGSYLRGRDKEDLMEMLPSLRNRLNGKIERTLRVSFDGLNNKKDEAIFLHIACLFNGETVNNIKHLLADSDLDVNIGLKNLVDKSLIHVRENIVEMHCLLQEMGKEIVRAQSNEHGERSLLVDSKNICDLLEDNTGNKKIIGIALDMDEIDELHIHENAFKGMPNLRFLKVYSNKRDHEKKEARWHLPEGFDYLPRKLRLLRLDGYPMRCMPSNFFPENLVKLEMQDSKLEKLWEGVHSLRGLKVINLQRSKSLKEIPDLSMATNLATLRLDNCSSLVELPSSIQYLNKLEELNMSGCINLETLPTGINLQSLDELQLGGCTRLKTFPDISTNITWLVLYETGIEKLPSNLGLKKLFMLSLDGMKSENIWERVQPLNSLMTILPHSLARLILSDIQSLVELPASIQNFTKLDTLHITNCINLETLSTSINFQFLNDLNLNGCSRLRNFPYISTNISVLKLCRTGIEEVPWWIENFSRLSLLYMNGCKRLQCVSLHISKLKHLQRVEFSQCGALNEARWNDNSNVVAMDVDKIHSKLPVLEDASSSFPDCFINCFNFDKDPKPLFGTTPQFDSKYMTFSGEEVPSYFTHRTTRTSLTNIPLCQASLSKSFFKFKVCVVVDFISSLYGNCEFHIEVSCRFKGILGNHSCKAGSFIHEKGIGVFIFGCGFPLNEDNASLAELNYDHVDIELHLSNRSYSTSKVIEWGIRLSGDFSSLENQLGNPHTRPHVETERSEKRIRIT